MDYETKQTYVLKVEGANPHIDPKFISWGPYKDEATIKVARTCWPYAHFLPS